MNTVATTLLAQSANTMGWMRDPSTWNMGGAIAGFVMLGVGLLLVLFGVKLVRVIFTLAFAGLGAGIGSLGGVALSNSVNFGHLPLIGAIAGALIIGLIGFLMYRFWTMLAFAALVAFIAAGVGIAIKDGVSPQQLRDSIKSINQPIQQTSVPAGGGVAVPNSPQADPQTRQQQAVEKAKELGRKYALVAGLSALGGFVLALVFSAFAFRAAAILWTSLIGIVYASAGAGVLLSVYRAEWLKSWEQMVWWQALLPVAGLWLIGISIQTLLARKKKTAEDVEEQPVLQ